MNSTINIDMWYPVPICNVYVQNIIDMYIYIYMYILYIKLCVYIYMHSIDVQ